MNRTFSLSLATAVCLCLLAAPAYAAAKKEKNPAPASAPAAFAPLPKDHELASVWNDPDFARRLAGSYGFLSGAEPSLLAEEFFFYTNKIKALLEGPEEQKKAIPLLEARLKQPTANALFDYLLGTILFQGEDLTNAVKHFENALAKFPDYRRAQRNLAFALFRDAGAQDAGADDQASRLVREAKYADATRALIRTIALTGGDGEVFGLLGYSYMSLGRYVSAEGAYRQALVFKPDNLDFKLGLLKCSVSTKNFDHALGLLDELLEQHPEREGLWTLHANIYIQKEQPAKAAVSLEMLRRLGKATPQNLFLLGDLYMAQEARDLALSSYIEALEKDGGKSPAKALRPAQILVGRGAWDEARQLFGKIRGAGTLTPEDELKLLKLESKVAMASGEGEKAVESLEQIIQKNPLDGEALLLAGDYYAKNGQREKAEFRYQTVASMTGSAFEADALVKHAQLLVQSQKYAQALELLRKAQKVKPRDNVQRYLDKIEQLARGGSHS